MTMTVSITHEGPQSYQAVVRVFRTGSSPGEAPVEAEYERVTLKAGESTMKHLHSHQTISVEEFLPPPPAVDPV